VEKDARELEVNDPEDIEQIASKIRIGEIPRKRQTGEQGTKDKRRQKDFHKQRRQNS
jgi:hypothetical protein